MRAISENETLSTFMVPRSGKTMRPGGADPDTEAKEVSIPSHIVSPGDFEAVYNSLGEPYAGHLSLREIELGYPEMRLLQFHDQLFWPRSLPLSVPRIAHRLPSASVRAHAVWAGYGLLAPAS